MDIFSTIQSYGALFPIPALTFFILYIVIPSQHSLFRHIFHIKKKRKLSNKNHLLYAVLWYSKSSPSSWSQCDLNPGRVKHISTFEASCGTVPSKFYFAMEFLLYLQTVLSLITTRIMMPREHVHSLYKCFFTPQLKAELLNVWVDDHEFFARVMTIESSQFADTRFIQKLTDTSLLRVVRDSFPCSWGKPFHFFEMQPGRLFMRPIKDSCFLPSP